MVRWPEGLEAEEACHQGHTCDTGSQAGEARSLCRTRPNEYKQVESRIRSRDAKGSKIASVAGCLRLAVERAPAPHQPLPPLTPPAAR